MAPLPFRRVLSLALAGIVVVAGLARADTGTGTAEPEASTSATMPAARALSETQRARMALDRLGFGPRPGEVARVAAMGVDAWIARQLHPETIADDALARHLAGLEVPAMSTAELYRRYPNPTAIRQQLKRAESAGAAADGDQDRRQTRAALAAVYREKGYGRPREVYLQLASDRLLRATYSERQLQEQMVDFWSNHFNVYARKNVSQWLLPAFDRDTIRPHVLGKFHDLLLATAQSPAMLFYLDNIESVAPDAQLNEAMASARRAQAKRLPSGINENYARELLELHTLGVDGGYTQQDIREVARCFTGWSVIDPRGYRAYAAISGDERLQQRLQRQGERYGQPADAATGTFYFNPRLHDNGVKVVLGHRIDAGGIGDGLAVIDLLARQPATARFIARKLAVKFVGDQPDPALVARVAAAFERSDGDIRQTLAALFSDPAFFAPGNYRAKIKTPFELVVSSLRALDADSNGREIQVLLGDLGQPLYGYQAPTGYPDTAGDWVNAGAMIKRMNFAVALAANRIPGTQVDLARAQEGSAPSDLLDAGLARWLDAEVAPSTRTTLQQMLAQPLPEATLDAPTDDEDAFGDDERQAGSLARNMRVRLQPSQGDPARIQVASLILGSPDFQRQ